MLESVDLTRSLSLEEYKRVFPPLQERLRQLMEQRTDKEVNLRGDSTVQYQDLMDIIDMLKGAGVQNIGMVSRMPSAR